MRRRSLKSSLARIALAYLLALQALLSAWAGHAMAATPNAFDPSLTLCRTAATDATQQSDRDAIVPSRCAVMCLSGACASGDPPAMVSSASEFVPLHGVALLPPVPADAAGRAPLQAGVNARGPPSIA